MRRLAGAFSIFAGLLSTVAQAGGPAATPVDTNVVRLSEPVEVTESYEVFGAPLNASTPALRLQELVDNSDRYLDNEVLVTARVAKVCQKKGCFFVAQDGNAVARVTFKDYAFFIPTDAGGKEVTLAGVFARRELSKSQAQHYQDDLGESRSEAPTAGVEYQIVATSIRIPRS